ncbi:hypothetical protein BJ508DRAFT_97566 [Ascobolus immersus RN42]|uniref:Uncharacterized protein n=1 Tax=Ascobolus immersus RN42 TaxID=1160509 RepID=A0A3N4IMX6_ASCIM|nr:hypothetical protein BJ508DRAFT_97566 [Ascobolus immersus RN42]
MPVHAILPLSFLRPALNEPPPCTPFQTDNPPPSFFSLLNQSPPPHSEPFPSSFHSSS